MNPGLNTDESKGIAMNEKGFVALESALVLPLLVFFGLALFWLLLAARTETALREAVEEAVKTAAAHAYPVRLAAEYAADSEPMRRIEERISPLMPDALRSLLRRELLGDMSGGTGQAQWSESALHRSWAEPLVRSFIDRTARGRPVLDPERLTVKAVILPTFDADENSYFGLAAEYRMPIPVPFFRKELVFSAAALERCWTGDSRGGGFL